MFLAFVALASLSAGLLAADGVQASAVNNQREANSLVSSVATIDAAAAMAGMIGAQINSTIQPGTTAASGQDRASATAYLGSGRQSGVAAGGQSEGLGVWARGSWSIMDNSETGGEYDGTVSNFGVGVDYKVTDTVLLGVALGWENMNIDTAFNRGTYEGAGFTIAPYIGVNLSDQLYVSAVAGYSDIDYDFTRTLNGSVTGATSGKRKFASANATYTVDKDVHGVDGLRLSPLAGIFWVSEKQQVYTDSNSTVVDGNTTELP
ncbi:MAG: autotransporter outer membrane beta-barrel domain-containing protein [Rhodospirillales bacterium]|nr:autotransporter outer membrane beta-barrel domain-containing protein [Rhodospirillales bacterium]